MIINRFIQDYRHPRAPSMSNLFLERFSRLNSRSQNRTSSTFGLHVVWVQVVGKFAVLSPEVQLPKDARLNHLLLPRDGDFARGKISVELGVFVVHDHAFDGAEGAHVVDVFGVDHLWIRDKRRREHSFREAG